MPLLHARFAEMPARHLRDRRRRAGAAAVGARPRAGRDHRERRSDHRLRHRAARQADADCRIEEGATRQQVIDELIDDKLKLSAAKGYKLEITQDRGRQRVRQYRPQHPHDAGKFRQRSRQRRHQSGHAESAPQGRPRLVADHPRQIPVGAADRRKGNPDDAGSAQHQGCRIRIRAHPDPVRDRARRGRHGRVAQARRRAAPGPVPGLQKRPSIRARACATWSCATRSGAIRRTSPRNCATCWTRSRSAG